MARVYPFHTSNEEDHKRSPVWHNDDECYEGKKIKSYDVEKGKKGKKCLICQGLNNQDED